MLTRRMIPKANWAASGHMFPRDENQMNWLLRNRHINGFDTCVVKVGRKVLIDESRYLKWLESHIENTDDHAD
jgi:hypothetical protein